jgi:Flp pilus assembly protein TadD
VPASVQQRGPDLTVRETPQEPRSSQNTDQKSRDTWGATVASTEFRESSSESALTASQLHNQAVYLAREGKLEQAIELFEKALALNPRSFDTKRNMALALAQRGRFADAERMYRDVLQAQPDCVQALHELANTLRSAKRLDEAVPLYRKAIQLDSQCAEFHHDLGLALSEMKQREQAEVAYREALRLKPDAPDVWNNLGVVLEGRGVPEEAVKAYQEALRLRPESPDVLNNLGVAFSAQRKFADAVSCYQQALQLAPNSPSIYSNLGNALRSEGRLDDAITSLQKAVELKPSYAEAHNNLGIVLVHSGRIDEGLGHYDRAIYLAPDYPEPHLNRSMALLARGDFDRGWTEYEWRWKGKNFARRKYRQPRWDGSDLSGRTILIYFEQGMGDTMQFIRYARMLKQRGATVLMQPHEMLLGILEGCPGIDRLISPGKELPPFDTHASLLSLPGLFKTTADNIPAEVPYLFARPDLVEVWRERIGQGPELKVGVVWQGNPQHRGDHIRSIPLRFFAELTKVSGIRWFSLQKGSGRDQLSQLSNEVPITDLHDQLLDFRETAAAIQNLDLVICCDTSVSHLAGALGRPVWMALPTAADWRWLRSGDTTAWYPTMRLFRQQQAGDWSTVFEQFAEALRHLVAQPREKPVPDPELRRRAQVHFEQGIALADKKQLDAALGCFQQATLVDPSMASAHHNAGAVLAMLKRLPEAEAAFRRALKLDSKYAEAHSNLGLALLEQGRCQEAAGSLTKALACGAAGASMHNHLGAALMDQNKPHEAMVSFRRALQLDPDLPEAHVNLSHALLNLGQFEEGWLENEWRAKFKRSTARTNRKVRWTGESAPKRTILLHTEGAERDTLQFIRYAPLVKERVGHVIVECQPALKRLLNHNPGIDTVISPQDPLPDFQLHASLLSLPWIFHTVEETIPSDFPYLQVDTGLADQWRERLEVIPGLRVGLAIAGSTSEEESPPAEVFQPLASAGPLQFVELGLTASPKSSVSDASATGLLARRWKLSNDYAVTASLLANLDLLICVDNDCCHLAGALGVPTWLVLGRHSHWRWMHDRTDSPWYPSVRIFRQQSRENVERHWLRVARSLKQFIAFGSRKVRRPSTSAHSEV